jgi:hypothetical protein
MLERSKNNAEQYCLFSGASFILFTILCPFYFGVPLPEGELMIGY